ncbi:MAG: hypothetical protein M3Y58_10060 [Chloroflexota bacterium]|nr:hypothetical protein [Chloroflexota bacterium]
MTYAGDHRTLHAEIAQLRGIMRGIASDDEAERQVASAQAPDAARVMAVLIRAVEAQQTLEHEPAAEAEHALAAVIHRALDAMTREEATQRATQKE